MVLQGYLARKTLLFIGYDLANSFFTDLYVKVSKPLDTYARQAYVFGESLSPKSEGWCSRHHITVLQASPKDSLLVLTRELAQKRVPRIASSQLAEKLPLPSLTRPYKFLDYYETNDASIFFGRDQVKIRLTSLIDAHRLVILYGASGTGKTSLLRAGVVPQLRNAEPPYVTVFVRMLEEPVPAIIGALQRQFSDLPDAVESETLRDFVAAACTTLGRTLVIFLDQFEEFFLRFPKPSREKFIAELGALHDASDIPVKVVLSLREDWLAALSELEERIPDLFRIKLRLLPLTRDEAYEAITAPAEMVGVRYETTLVDQLLGELMGSGGRNVSPPQLQLVCTALYDQLPPGEQEISLVMYNQLGGARGILQQYLANELDRFAPNERVLIDVLMGELITSQGTKKVKTATDLAFTLDVDQATTASLLERLTRARLLRMLKLESGETAYELSHEYLIRGIGLDTKAKARKAAKQLIEQEMENWKHFSTLMSEDKFKLIEPVRDELRLEAPVQGFLLRSAILADHSIGYWLTRVQDQQIRIGALADLARYGLPDVRRRVAGLLGEANRPEAIEPLLALVFDPDASVRTAARASLTRYPEQQPTIVGELEEQGRRRE